MRQGYNLEIVVSAVDRATKVIHSIGRSTANIAKRMGRQIGQVAVRAVQNLIRSLVRLAKIAVIAGAAIAEELVRRSINAFAAYEQAVINAITVTGRVGDAFQAAKKSLFDFGLELSVQSNKMATEIAGAFYALSSAGLTLIETMAASRGVLALAEGTLADMGLTTELTTSAMKAFQLPATAMNRIVNALAATIGASRMNMERLAGALPYAAASAKEFNISLEGMLAALALVVDRGVEASMAGTQFRMMLAQSANVTKEGAKALAKYGLDMGAVNVQALGLSKVLKTLRDRHVQYSDLIKIFGLRAATMAAILVRNVDELVDMQKAVTGTNTAFRMQRQQLDSVTGQWKAFLGDVQKLGIQFARTFEPAIRTSIDALRELVQRLAETDIAKKVGGWFTGIVKAVPRAAESILHFFRAIDHMMKEFAVGGGFEAIKRASWDLTKFVGNAFLEMSKRIADAFRDMLRPFTEGMLRYMLPEVLGAVKLLDEAVQGIEDAQKKLGETTFEEAKRSFEDFGDSIRTVTKRDLPSFAEAWKATAEMMPKPKALGGAPKETSLAPEGAIGSIRPGGSYYDVQRGRWVPIGGGGDAAFIKEHRALQEVHLSGTIEVKGLPEGVLTRPQIKDIVYLAAQEAFAGV